LTNVNTGQFEPTGDLPPKYNKMGGFNTKSFASHNIPKTLVLALVESANHGLATNTQKSYKTAVRHIKRVEEVMGRKLTFPFTVSSTLAYIGYLLHHRKVTAGTIEKYLSGLRMYHLQMGHFSAWIKPEIVSIIIRGTANKNQIVKRMSGKEGRLPVTPDVMKTINLNLKKINLPLSRKRTIWLCCTLCWAGAFRIHEILARKPEQFDPTSTLLYRDIKEITVKMKDGDLQALKITIKHPKEERLSAGVVIDVFQIKGACNWMCPVKAWTKWNKDKRFHASSSKPAIRMADGRSYTGGLFNRDLKSILKTTIDYNVGSITAHSFRSGLATFMSKGSYLLDTCGMVASPLYIYMYIYVSFLLFLLLLCPNFFYYAPVTRPKAEQGEFVFVHSIVDTC
jgi:hypothetical protein